MRKSAEPDFITIFIKGGVEECFMKTGIKIEKNDGRKKKVVNRLGILYSNT